jgi:hypothetical protein
VVTTYRIASADDADTNAAAKPTPNAAKSAPAEVATLHHFSRLPGNIGIARKNENSVAATRDNGTACRYHVARLDAWRRRLPGQTFGASGISASSTLPMRIVVVAFAAGVRPTGSERADDKARHHRREQVA